MKTFAQLKRDLKVGTKLKCIFNYHGKYLNVVRPITKVQTNAVYLKTETENGTVNSYLDFPPKASLVKYDENVFEFYFERNGELIKQLAYEIVEY